MSTLAAAIERSGIAVRLLHALADFSSAFPEPDGHPEYPPIIGIAGHKRAGKTTLANWLAPHLGYAHESFAGPIRKTVCLLCNLEPDELESAKECAIGPLGGITPRKLMQYMGDIYRHGDPDFWVRSLFDRVRGPVVISDVRYPNEAQEIIRRGGVVIRVTRPVALTDDPHESEVPLPNELVSCEIRNDRTICDLYLTAARYLGV